jgi:uncharacterized FAD-dependent dehydrogenase
VNDYDLIIVGAGPGGLAAAARLAGSGHRVALIDAGKPVDERDRHAEVDMTRGHGGAGLFSDGKFSFFPSATELWSLSDQPSLRRAYDWTCRLLGDAGLLTPPFPSDPTAFTIGSGEWVLKEYPSDYLSLDVRLSLTRDMVAASDAVIINETEVVSAHYDPGTDAFDLELRDVKGQESRLRTHRLIVLTGRFGPLGLPGLTTRRSFRRLEIGFRIEQPAGDAFFREMRQLDPKLRFREADGSVEWRTFCACRDGETVLTETQGLWTVSGRSDCPPTGRSNIGFNTRIMDHALAVEAFAPALAAMSREESYFAVPMHQVIDGDPRALEPMDNVYGPTLRALMVRGLERLGGAFPALRADDVRLIGPTLEGVGWYPQVDGDLALLDVPAWVGGDACGLFRGIVAAMISGHYVASAALAQLPAR